MKIWSCLAVLLLITGCKSKPNEEAAADVATPVKVTAAKRVSMHRLVSAEAILYPVNQATIVPKISAPVRQFSVQRGDHVKKGQLLAVLEAGDLQATTAESQQLYQQAQANLENTGAATLPDDLTRAKSDAASAQQGVEAARAVYENRVSLFKQGALAQKLVDDAKLALVEAQSRWDTAKQHLHSLEAGGQSAQLKSAEAQMNAAKAHYESSAAQSAYSEVRSPIAGIVADRGVNVGDMVSSGLALFTIVDLSRVVAHASVPVNDASALRPGQTAVIKGGAGDVEGRVVVVSPAVDPGSTTVQVWVEGANPGEALKLGSSVMVTIDAGEVPDAVSVPQSALLAAEEGGEKVMVALSNGTAAERKVTVGVRNGGDIQILSGVNPGENVVTQGGLGLDDGAKIEIGKTGEDK